MGLHSRFSKGEECLKNNNPYVLSMIIPSKSVVLGKTAIGSSNTYAKMSIPTFDYILSKLRWNIEKGRFTTAHGLE